MSDPRLHTRLCDLVGVRYPIVQTGMGWVAGPRLAIATAKAGGLGILAAATLTFDEMVSAIDEVRAGTDASFGVNMRTDADDVERRVEHLITAEVKVASFAQAPGQATVARLKEAGVVVIPTIGARRHAEKVAEWGVDAVIAQGTEGGGHTGVVPTSLLIPQVLDAVDLPVIAAGGFVDGRGLAAALAWGADGIAMGTRFPRAAANALRFRRLTGTSLRALLAEGIRMKKAQDLTWGQVALAANAPMLTRATMVEGRTEVGILPTGQGVGSIDELPSVADLVSRIVAEATEALDRLCEG